MIWGNLKKKCINDSYINNKKIKQNSELAVFLFVSREIFCDGIPLRTK